MYLDIILIGRRRQPKTFIKKEIEFVIILLFLKLKIKIFKFNLKIFYSKSNTKNKANYEIIHDDIIRHRNYMCMNLYTFEFPPENDIIR